MTSVSLRRQFRFLVPVLLLLLALLPTTATSVSAQTSTDAALAAAQKFLRNVPGLKGQLPNLAITGDPRGDAAAGGDAL